jgi:hypothetical protein
MTLYRQVVLAVTSLSLHLCWEPLCSLLGKRWLIWQFCLWMALYRYALPHAKTGDVIAIGETPLAIMQGAASGLACCLTLTHSISRCDRSFVIDKSHKDPFLVQLWSCWIFFDIFLTWMMSIEKVWLLMKSFCLSNLGHEDQIAEAATA